MINLFAISFTVMLFTGTGYNLSRAFAIGNIVERLGLSFLLGSGLGTFLWFILYLLGVPFTFTSLILACCLASLCGIFFGKHPTVKHINSLQLSKLDWALILIIILGLLASFVIGNYNPITAWDSMALYDSRAHMITLSHSLLQMPADSYYYSYPLFVSLLHATVYFLGGTNAQGMHAIIFMAFLGIIYGRLYDWTNHRFALYGVLLNLFIYDLFYHATIAYANLPYLAFLISGILYVLTEKYHSHGRFLLLSGLLFGLSTWVRSTEVFWILGILMIFWHGHRWSRLWSSFISVFLLLTLKFGWSLYFQAILKTLPIAPLAPAPLFSAATITGIIHSLPLLPQYLLNYSISPYIGFWSMAIGIFILSSRYQIKRARSLVLFATSCLVITAIGTAIYSTFFPTWHAIGDSVRRMLMFLSPLITTAAVITIHKVRQHEHWN